MAAQDNSPQLTSVLNRLVMLPPNILARFTPDNGQTYPLLQEELDQAISWVEDEASTSFNPTWLPPYGVDYDSSTDYDFLQADDAGVSTATLKDGTVVGLEKYDGNTTNQIVLRKRPVIDIALLQVVTPILGYTRVYTREEIKLYPRQGIIKVFTYKLAVEQALLQTIDYQAWGNLFPPLPQAVQVAYCYGFPTYDPDSTADDANTGHPINGPGTSLDGGHSWIAGDQRDEELNNWLANLQEAAICQACAQFLTGTILQAGIVGSVSFDGYSRSLSPAAITAAADRFEARRDKLLERRKRQFYMATLG